MEETKRRTGEFVERYKRPAGCVKRPCSWTIFFFFPKLSSLPKVASLVTRAPLIPKEELATSAVPLSVARQCFPRRRLWAKPRRF